MLEICVDGIESAFAAIGGGAQRLELCSALSEGGLTPTIGLLKVVKNKYPNVECYAMLRPRRGNDFCYSNYEVECILEDMKIFHNNKIDGFVFGALTVDYEIDENICSIISQYSQNLPITFHRAFDLTSKCKYIESYQKIEAMGYRRILTSGFEQNAELGLDNIRKLQEIDRNIIIMPGAGITPQNAERILLASNCNEFHASARIKKLVRSTNISMGVGEMDLETIMICDSDIVKQLVAIGKKFIK